jgi:transcriptional regulator with XRE-family HTH domain
MRGRASDLIVIPDSFWGRAEIVAALRDRDVGKLFELLSKYTGASQTQIGIACEMSQGKVSNIVRGVQQVEKLAIFERIAGALDMPDPGRTALGLAPRRAAEPIPSAHTRPVLNPSSVSGLLTSTQETSRRTTTRCDGEPSWA